MKFHVDKVRFVFNQQKIRMDNDSYSTGFNSRNEKQNAIVEEFKKLRAVFGTPHPFAYMRAVVRTRKYTRTVYPPGWKFR